MDACASCGTRAVPLRASAHLGTGVAFCDADCRDAYIGATHRYRPLGPDHVLVPVGSPLAAAWRAAFKPLVGKKLAPKTDDRRHYVMPRLAVEPIAAALQRIGPQTKRGAPEDEEERETGDASRAKLSDTGTPPSPGGSSPAAAATVSPAVPSSPLPAVSSSRSSSTVLASAPESGILEPYADAPEALKEILSALDDTDLLGMAIAFAGTRVFDTLASDAFWYTRLADRYGGAGSEAEFLVGEVFRNILELAVSPYALIENGTVVPVVYAAWRQMFAIMVLRTPRTATDPPGLSAVQLAFRSVYHRVLYTGSINLLKFVQTHQYDGEPARLNVPAVTTFAHGPTLGTIVPSTFNRVVDHLTKTEGGEDRRPPLPLAINPRIEADLATAHERFLRCALDWRDAAGRHIHVSAEDSAQIKVSTENDMRGQLTPGLVGQLARMALLAPEMSDWLVSYFARILVYNAGNDRQIALELTRIVAPDDVTALDPRKVFEYILSVPVRRSLFSFVDIREIGFRHDCISVLLQWRHATRPTIGIDPNALLDNAIKQAQDGTSLLRCIPEFAAHGHNAATGERVDFVRDSVMTAIAAQLARNSPLTLLHAANAILALIRYPHHRFYVTDAFLNCNYRHRNYDSASFIPTANDCAKAYLLALNRNRATVPPSSRVVTRDTFMRVVPPPGTLIWFTELEVYDDMLATPAVVPMGEWLAANAREYFTNLGRLNPLEYNRLSRDNLLFDYDTTDRLWEWLELPLRTLHRLRALLASPLLRNTLRCWTVTTDPSTLATRKYDADAIMTRAEADTIAAFAADGVPLIPTDEERRAGLYGTSLFSAPPPSPMPASEPPQGEPPSTPSSTMEDVDARIGARWQ